VEDQLSKECSTEVIDEVCSTVIQT